MANSSYSVMMDCWQSEPEKRLNFSQARESLAKMLEDTVEDYSYLSLNQERDYYNVPYSDQDASQPSTSRVEDFSSVTLEFDNRAFEPITEENAEEVKESEPLPSTRIANQRHDSGLDMGADSVSVSSAEEMPPAPPVPPRRNHLDSSSSDRFLITPFEDAHRDKFRFSFKGIQERLGNVSEAAEFNDSGFSTGVSNTGYTDFMIKHPPPPPPPRRDL